MEGSYASLSFCPPVRPSFRPTVIIHDNNSYLEKYYSYESETLPQYKALIAAYRKIPITLSEVYLSPIATKLRKGDIGLPFVSSSVRLTLITPRVLVGI